MKILLRTVTLGITVCITYIIAVALIDVYGLAILPIALLNAFAFGVGMGRLGGQVETYLENNFS